GKTSCLYGISQAGSRLFPLLAAFLVLSFSSIFRFSQRQSCPPAGFVQSRSLKIFPRLPFVQASSPDKIFPASGVHFALMPVGGLCLIQTLKMEVIMKAYQNQPARDVYQIITDLIVEKLESGFIPWRRPWSAYGPAVSYVTRKPYR